MHNTTRAAICRAGIIIDSANIVVQTCPDGAPTIAGEVVEAGVGEVAVEAAAGAVQTLAKKATMVGEVVAGRIAAGEAVAGRIAAGEVRAVGVAVAAPVVGVAAAEAPAGVVAAIAVKTIGCVASDKLSPALLFTPRNNAKLMRCQWGNWKNSFEKSLNLCSE